MDSGDDLNSRGINRPPENYKVYTRRVNKKAPKTSNNNDTASTATTTAGDSVGAAAASTSDYPTPTRPPTEVPSAAATTATTSEVPTTTSEEPKDSAAASPPPTTGHSDGGDGVVQDFPETIVAKDGDSCQHKLQEQSPNQEQSLSHRSADKNVDEQEQHRHHLPSPSEDNCSTQHQTQRDGGCENPELQNDEDLPLPNSNEAHNLENQSPVKSLNEIPQTSGDGVQKNLRESSPLSSENDLPNGGDVAVARVPIENDRESLPVPPQAPSGNEPVDFIGVVKPLLISRVDDRVRFNLARATPKNEINDLRKKLMYELDHVRRLVKQLEAKEHQLASYNSQIRYSNISNNSTYIGSEGGNIGRFSHPQPLDARTDLVDRRLFLRVNSDMGAARNLEPRPYSRQLSVAVNNPMSGEYIEKEKRTPKANQLYRNSEFLLGKDRLPPEGNKRLTKSSGRKHSRNHMFKSCDSLLQRLMKHKYGWVFNEPVDAQELGLFDYHDIIKHPMDLGTIKKRLTQNWYKSPMEFAEDVRLVFRNAMTYNPKGQDVHVMAEQLLQIFEEKWVIIEADYNAYWKYQMAMPTPVAVDPKFKRPPVVRAPVQKKPKAKDPNKRDMTYEEKQKLGTHLQNLPPEKLDAIVHIVNRRSSALSQHGEEIEVDIDNCDTETLWELDRFVTNYKKRLSKHKRKAELALQARPLANQTNAVTNTNPAVAEAQTESGTAFEKSNAPLGVEGEKQGHKRSRSISSSSSSSDSGSSSSDSDSDSSSEDSDAGHSPGT